MYIVIFFDIKPPEAIFGGSPNSASAIRAVSSGPKPLLTHSSARRRRAKFGVSNPSTNEFCHHYTRISSLDGAHTQSQAKHRQLQSPVFTHHAAPTSSASNRQRLSLAQLQALERLRALVRLRALASFVRLQAAHAELQAPFASRRRRALVRLQAAQLQAPFGSKRPQSLVRLQAAELQVPSSSRRPRALVQLQEAELPFGSRRLRALAQLLAAELQAPSDSPSDSIQQQAHQPAAAPRPHQPPRHSRPRWPPGCPHDQPQTL